MKITIHFEWDEINSEYQASCNIPNCGLMSTIGKTFREVEDNFFMLIKDAQNNNELVINIEKIFFQYQFED